MDALDARCIVRALYASPARQRIERARAIQRFFDDKLEFWHMSQNICATSVQYIKLGLYTVPPVCGLLLCRRYVVIWGRLTSQSWYFFCSPAQQYVLTMSFRTATCVNRAYWSTFGRSVGMRVFTALHSVCRSRSIPPGQKNIII